MSDPLIDLWKSQPTAASPLDTTELARRDRALRRRLKLRDATEFLAGGLVIVAFGYVAWIVPDLAIRAAAILELAGVALVLTTLWRRRPRGDAEVLGVPVRDHYRAELVRQRDMLASVWRWYIGPIVPGMLAFFAAVAWASARATGDIQAAFPGLALLVPILGVFWLVGRINAAGARRLDAEIAELDSEAAK